MCALCYICKYALLESQARRCNAIFELAKNTNLQSRPKALLSLISFACAKLTKYIASQTNVWLRQGGHVMKKSEFLCYLSEFFGTFALTLAVIVSLNNTDFPVPTPFVAGLTVALFVYTIGHISGCHINPAVTIAALVINQIKPFKAVAYIIFQLLGGFTAKCIASFYLTDPASWLAADDDWRVAYGEAIGAMFFTFGIAAVMLNQVPKSMSGFVIGGSLLLGIIISAHTSHGLLNPAVAIGTGAFSMTYLLSPIVGGIVGMLIYKLLSLSQK